MNIKIFLFYNSQKPAQTQFVAFVETCLFGKRFLTFGCKKILAPSQRLAHNTGDKSVFYE